MVSKLLVRGLFLVAIFCPFAANANEVKEIEAHNTKAWVIEDHQLPIISVQLVFKNAGYAHDPKNKQGLGFFTSSALNEGAGNISSKEFQATLEQEGIEFSPDIDEDNFYLSIKTISSKLDTALKLAKLAITKPSFNPEDVERVRGQIYSILKKDNEDDEVVAQKSFNKEFFKDHPYSNIKDGTEESVSSITPDDLHNFVKEKFARDNVVVSIVGDVDDDTSKKILSDLASGLPEKSVTSKVPEFTNYPKAFDKKVKLNNPQTKVLFALKGIKRQDPDYYAAYLLNHIFGGDGFSARLVQQVREKNGLAYYIGTTLQSNDEADLFMGTVATKNESVDKSVAIIKYEFQKLSEKGVTEKELEEAKSYITGSFGLNLDKNEKLALFLTSMQLNNLGKDYLEKRNDYFNSVTLDQVNKVVKELIRPEKLVFIRVGM